MTEGLENICAFIAFVTLFVCLVIVANGAFDVMFDKADAERSKNGTKRTIRKE